METITLIFIIEILVYSAVMFITMAGFNAWCINWKLSANTRPIMSAKASKKWHRYMWWNRVFLHLIILRLTWYFALSTLDIIGIQLLMTLFSIIYYDLFINKINFTKFYIDYKGINKSTIDIINKILKILTKKENNQSIAKPIYWIIRFLPPVIGAILILI